MTFRKILFIIPILILTCLQSFSQQPFFESNNPGYYGSQYTDQQLYDLMYNAGMRSTRSAVSIVQELQYGMATFQARLQYPYSTKGFRNNVFFLYATPSGGTYPGRDPTVYGGQQTWKPAGLYDSVFHFDGSINTSNVYGLYVYNVIQSVGPYYGIYEVWNEPDLTFSPDAYLDSTQSSTSWQKVEPAAQEFYNLIAPIADYVQMCNVANQVVKKYQPTAKIATGGLGYKWWYMWALRHGIASYVDYLSIHEYPYYGWTLYPNINNRHSDGALAVTLAEIDGFRQIETQEHATHIPMMMTETNVPRWEFDKSSNAFPNNKRYGSDHVQRNYTIKAYAKLYQDSLIYLALYQLGESADSGNVSGSEITAMGLFKNLTTITPGHEVLTQQGISTTTMYTLLHNYTVNHTPIAGLPAGCDGVEIDSAGVKGYIVWAQTKTDTSEVAGPISWTIPGVAIYHKYLYDGTTPGTVTGTISLIGDPVILLQSSSSPPPPPPGCNCVTTNVKAVNGYQSEFSFGNSLIVPLIDDTIIVDWLVTEVNIPPKWDMDPKFDLFRDIRVPTIIQDTSITCTNPTVSAGNSQTITLPTSSVTIAGTAKGNNLSGIKSVVWKQISGPAASLSSPNSSSTAVTNLTATSSFSFSATDSCGYTGSSTVTINVNPAPTVTTTSIRVVDNRGVTTVQVTQSNGVTTPHVTNKQLLAEKTTLTNGKIVTVVTFTDQSNITYQ